MSIKEPWRVWLPRLRSGGCTLFKDLHAVLGLYLLVFACITLFTGPFFTRYFQPYFGGVMERMGLYPEGKKRPAVFSKPAGATEPMAASWLLEKLEIVRPFGLLIRSTRDRARDPGWAFVVRVGDIGDLSIRHGIHFNQYMGRRLGEGPRADASLLLALAADGIRTW